MFPESDKLKEFDPLRLNYSALFDRALSGFKVDQRRFYTAKIRRHPDSPAQSDKLIERQRLLKTKLEKDGFETIIAGSVRGHNVVGSNGKTTVVFREKGVDVRLAIDTVANTCDGTLSTALICSSDSDLQPAIDQIKKRGVKVVYVGFEAFQNKGMTYTAHRTILLRNSELVACYCHKS